MVIVVGRGVARELEADLLVGFAENPEAGDGGLRG